VAEQGLLAAASTTLLWNWGLTRVPASQAGIFVNLEPLVGAILGLSVLHETLGMTALAVGALILGAAAYLSIEPERGAKHGRSYGCELEDARLSMKKG